MSPKLAAGTLGDTITPIDLATDKTLAPITVGPGPTGHRHHPERQPGLCRRRWRDRVRPDRWPFGSTVTPVDLTTGKALAPIAVGNAPVAVVITPDGSTALVANPIRAASRRSS